MRLYRSGDVPHTGRRVASGGAVRRQDAAREKHTWPSAKECRFGSVPVWPPCSRESDGGRRKCGEIERKVHYPASPEPTLIEIVRWTLGTGDLVLGDLCSRAASH